jgi:molybdate transport system substrate-binding protein
MIKDTTLAGALIWVFASIVPGIIDAAEVKVISTGSFKEALEQLGPAFEKLSGHKVMSIWAGTDEIIRRLDSGETLDVVIAPAPVVDQLIKRDLVLASGRTDVAKSGIGIAMRSGVPKVKVHSGDALKNALLAAQSIVLSSGVSGVYLTGLFGRWGIAEQIRSKIITLPGAPPVIGALVRGEAEIGFLQVSELLPVNGIEFLGPLPADIQQMTAITAVLGKATGAPDAATSLMKFLVLPDVAPVKRKTGLEPS